MKALFFTRHPDKKYLWRLTKSAQKRFGRMVEHNDFCKQAYYTKELSDLMYKHIKEADTAEHFARNPHSNTGNVIDMQSTLLRKMCTSLQSEDYENYLRIKNLFI